MSLIVETAPMRQNLGRPPRESAIKNLSRPRAAQLPTRAAPSADSLGASNALPAGTLGTKTMSPILTLSRKEQLQQEVRMLLESEDGWWRDEADMPFNMVAATSPKHFKSIVLASASHQPSSSIALSQPSIVVAYFFSPSCRGCRSLWPKLKQIATNNSDVSFVKINTVEGQLADLATGMGVSKLPYFLIFEAGSAKMLASFTANVSTAKTLRAEIAAAKGVAPQCATWGSAIPQKDAVA